MDGLTYTGTMPKRKKQKKGKIPPWGRSEADLDRERLRTSSADVPLGNTDPTVVRGVMYGGMPNASRMARGPVRQYRGKRT